MRGVRSVGVGAEIVAEEVYGVAVGGFAWIVCVWAGTAGCAGEEGCVMVRGVVWGDGEGEGGVGGVGEAEEERAEDWDDGVLERHGLGMVMNW